jgi:hypothetical protein
MPATQNGTDMTLGAAVAGLTLVNASNYILETVVEGDKNLDTEDVFDENGALITRIIFNAHAKVDVTMLCKANAAPTTDYVPGSHVANTWYVESCTVTKTKSPHRVQVSLVNIGFNA